MSALLDTLITMAFVYTLMSILVTFMTETWNRFRKLRGKLLKKALIRLLNDPLNKNYCELLYEHPLVRGMRVNEKHLPSYISTPVFIDAFLDLLRREGNEPHVYMTTDGNMHVAELPTMDAFQSVRNGIGAMAHSPLKTRLTSMLDNTTDIATFRGALVTWYNEYQDSITGIFKESTKRVAIIMGCVLSFMINVDSISLFREVYTNEQLRDVMVQEAINWSTQNPTLPATTANLAQNDTTAAVDLSVQQSISDVGRRMDSLNHYLVENKLPVGWNCPNCCEDADKSSLGFWQEFTQCIKSRWGEKSKADRVVVFLGWIFTTIAISFGAPVWFDLLNKFISLRSGKPKPGSIAALTKTQNHE
jgi:hypothetical protein